MAARLSKVNSVHLPRGGNLCQVQNKIILSRIDLCEGLNQCSDTRLYLETSQQASGYRFTFSWTFSLISTELNTCIWKLKDENTIKKCHIPLSHYANGVSTDMKETIISTLEKSQLIGKIEQNSNKKILLCMKMWK